MNAERSSRESRPVMGGAATRWLDASVRSWLGMMPFEIPGDLNLDAVDPAAFWAASAVGRPALAGVAWELGSGAGSTRIVDLEGPSCGHGAHPGGCKLLARARLQPEMAAPMVLILHGFAVPSSLHDEVYARSLAARGIHAVRLDLPFHLRRRVAGSRSGCGYFCADLECVRTSIRQSVEDAAAVVAWARREGVTRVGLLGFSLGGLVALLLAALTPVDDLVAVTPFCDAPGTFISGLPGRVRRRLGLVNGSGGVWGPDLATARQALERSLAPVVPANLAPVTPGVRCTLVSAGCDIIVGPGPVCGLAERWGTELWEYPHHGHITVLGARGLADRIADRLCAR